MVVNTFIAEYYTFRNMLNQYQIDLGLFMLKRSWYWYPFLVTSSKIFIYI